MPGWQSIIIAILESTLNDMKPFKAATMFNDPSQGVGGKVLVSVHDNFGHANAMLNHDQSKSCQDVADYEGHLIKQGWQLVACKTEDGAW